MSVKTKIVEGYACLQGEGKYMGVPSLMFRFAGCPMRCQFSETDFCDSWYTSWKPNVSEMLTWDEIEEIFKSNMGIKHTIISGGSPTMHGAQLQQLSFLAYRYGHLITIESEGSKFPTQDFYCNFLSLSPKLSNSTPMVGSEFHHGDDPFKVSNKHYRQHEKHRKNYGAMKKLIGVAFDYQLKFVVGNDFESVKDEIRTILSELDVPNEKVYLMPAGGTREELDKNRVAVMEVCIEHNFNYSDRLHIIAYDDKRKV